MTTCPTTRTRMTTEWASRQIPLVIVAHTLLRSSMFIQAKVFALSIGSVSRPMPSTSADECTPLSRTLYACESRRWLTQLSQRRSHCVATALGRKSAATGGAPRRVLACVHCRQRLAARAIRPARTCSREVCVSVGLSAARFESHLLVSVGIRQTATSPNTQTAERPYPAVAGSRQRAAVDRIPAKWMHRRASTETLLSLIACSCERTTIACTCVCPVLSPRR